MNVNHPAESCESGETAAAAQGQKVQDQAATDQESCSILPSPELIQRKYKCFIIYAISIVSIIELILIMFNNESGSSKSVLDVLTRYVNRTHTMM
jgi:hypothetical protein